MEVLAADLGDAVHTDHPVTHIEQDDFQVLVRGDGFEWTADRVVVALPPPLIPQIRFSPALSRPRERMLSATTMGSVVKIGLVYSEPFWKKQGLSGALWSTTGPVNVCYETTPLGTKRGVLSALSVAGSADELGALSPEQRQAAVLDALATHLGPEAKSPDVYRDLVWRDEPFSAGGYSMVAPPGAFAEGPAALRAPEGRVHFAGSETARCHPGYMEGALESAERVSEEVLRALERSV